MKRTAVVSLVVMVTALMLAGVAAALTPQNVAARTTAVFNKKLAFIGSPFRVAGVRCLMETSTFWYCRGSLRGQGAVVAAAWNVTLRNGTLIWAKE